MPGLAAITIEGAASGEMAFHFADSGGTLVVGDALINFEPYGFTMLPAKYCSNQKQMRGSLRQLLDWPFERLLFAHGSPILSSARARTRNAPAMKDGLPNESGLTRFLRLIRFSHTIFALPFALGALLVATHGRPSARLLTLVLACMICARTAAMLFNRIVDWSLDQRNPRTAGRHHLISRTRCAPASRSQFGGIRCRGSDD